MTQIVEPGVFQAPEALRKMLSDEAIATAKYLEYKKKAEEWETYRNQFRASINLVTGGARIVKIGNEVVATSAPKDQFSGKKFTTEYPTLAEEYMRVRSVLELDVEALRKDHPEIADRFTVVAFTNKVA